MSIFTKFFSKKSCVPPARTMKDVIAKIHGIETFSTPDVPGAYIRILNLDRRLFLSELLEAHPKEYFACVLTAILCDQDGNFLKTADDFGAVSSIDADAQEKLIILYSEAVKKRKELPDFFGVAAQNCAPLPKDTD